mgnify:CR=1 FL=1
MAIHRHCEWNRLLNDVRLWRSAFEVVITDDICGCRLCTEATSRVGSELFEVVSPYLNWRCTIFWSVPGIDRMNSRALIEDEALRVDYV